MLPQQTIPENQVHYDANDGGKWDGQLPAADILDQLPQAEPTPPPWPTVFARMEWADGIVAARLYRGATAAVFHRMTTRAGTATGCTESVGNIAKGLGIDRRSVQRAIKTIGADGFMAVTASINSTYICVPNLDRGAAQCHGGGGTVSPQGGGTVSPKGNSSSKEKIKKTETGKEATPVAIPAGKSGDTTGDFSSIFSEEEGVREYEDTGIPPTATFKDTTELTDSARAAVSAEDVAAWVAGHVSELPADSEIEALGKHCWPVWEKHFKTVDFEGALVVWKNDRAKFRRDLPRHLVKVGIPKPIGRTDEDIRAQEIIGRRLDIALAVGKRAALTHCQGCKLKRQLPTGQTHCYDCRRGELDHPHQIAGWTCRACGLKMTPEARATECNWTAQA